MYIEKLNYIIEVSKERSITKTAQKLHISASVISQSISQLEKDWGLKLFVRTKTGILLTEEGKAVIKKVSEVLAKYQELKDEISIQTSLTKTKLKISVVPSLAETTFNALLDFKQDFPEVDVHMQEMNRLEVLKEIKERKSDVGLLPISEQYLSDEIHIAYEKFFKGKLCVCVKRDSPLSYYEILTPLDLMNENFAIYSAEYAKNFFKQYFKGANTLFTTSNTEIIKRAVVEGLAITFSYDKPMKNDPSVLSGEMVTVPLQIQGLEEQQFWDICTRDKPFTNITKEFINYVKKRLY